MIEAAKIAEAPDLIMQQPQGYETIQRTEKFNFPQAQPTTQVKTLPL